MAVVSQVSVPVPVPPMVSNAEGLAVRAVSIVRIFVLVLFVSSLGRKRLLIVSHQ